MTSEMISAYYTSPIDTDNILYKGICPMTNEPVTNGGMRHADAQRYVDTYCGNCSMKKNGNGHNGHEPEANFSQPHCTQTADLVIFVRHPTTTGTNNNGHK